MTFHQATRAEFFDALCQSILDEYPFAENPYIGALRDGSFEFDDFVETQIQFAFVVTFFSRPMAVSAAKIADPELRLEIMRNVWEEHGEGNLERSHGATFAEFLDRLAGVTPERLQRKELWPEARLFDTVLAGAASLDEALVSVGMFGMIERMFVDISAAIGRAVVDRGWLAHDRMVHYDLHAELDVRHAEDFFRVQRRAWEGDPDSRYFIEQGLRLGACAFDGLYRGLYHARKRRVTNSRRSAYHART